MAAGDWGIGETNSALIGAFGSIASSAMSYRSNKRLLQIQQRWQEHMSNTAHQREVADLKAAGLNPILSGLGGSGASFGSASAPSMSYENPASAGLNSALAYRQQKNQDKMTKAQENNLNADSYLKGNQANTEAERFSTQIAETEYRHSLKSQIDNEVKNANKLLDYQIEEIKSRIQANNAQSYYNRHRALGYSESESYNTHSDNTKRSGTWRIGPLSNTAPYEMDVYGYGRTRSRSY